MAPGEDINKLYRISAAVNLMLFVNLDSSSALTKCICGMLTYVLHKTTHCHTSIVCTAFRLIRIVAVDGIRGWLIGEVQ